MNSFMLLSSAAFGLPVVQAKASSADPTDTNDAPRRKIKVSSIPLYPEPEKYTYSAKPSCRLEGIVKDTRIQATNLKAEYQPVIDKVTHVVETGKAHTNEALWHLRDEKNIGSQLGAMAVGGILGLIAARKRGFIKRITNMFVGVGAVGSVCYPEQAKIVAGDTGKFALKNARIAYNFVIGARPAVQNENGKPFERVMGMTSDIGKWGFNLFEKEKPAAKTELAQEETAQEPELKVQAEEVVQSEKPIEPTAEIAEVSVPQPESQIQEATVEVLPNENIAETPIDSSTSGEQSPTEAAPPPANEGEEPETGNLDTPTKEPKKEEEIVPATPATVVYEEDLGQGTLEDKELYTTRE